MAKADRFDEPGDGETTRRVKLAVHGEMQTVKKIQFWVTLGLTVAGLGFGVAMFANRYAQKVDLEKVVEKQDTISEKMQEHIENESSRLGSIQAQNKRIEEDYHFQREQVWRIADRVGASRVKAPPVHKEEEQ